MGAHDTLGRSFKLYTTPSRARRVGCDTVIALHLFTCVFFFFSFLCHSLLPSLCALHLTPNIWTYCFHLLEYWSSLISLSSSNFNQVNGCLRKQAKSHQMSESCYFISSSVDYSKSLLSLCSHTDLMVLASGHMAESLYLSLLTNPHPLLSPFSLLLCLGYSEACKRPE